MYNRLLDTFLTVADCGSFNRAAEQLHISSTAIIKQINQLEDEVGVPLFHRNPRGVSLTRAGEALRMESREMIQFSRNALERVRQTAVPADTQVRLGTSLLRPANYFLKLWADQYGRPLEHQVRIVPFLDNTYEGYLEVVSHLGEDIDVIAAPFPPELPDYACNALEITRAPFCCGVPVGHRLAGRRQLEVRDLQGEQIVVLEQGRSGPVDAARAVLEQCGGITLIDVPDYTPDTFNRCVTERTLLLTMACWKCAHPLLQCIPIRWNCCGVYGLLYAREPSRDTRTFIDFIQRSLHRK